MNNTELNTHATTMEVNMKKENFNIVDVVSSAIKKLGYSKKDKDLFVEFSSGKQYLYHGVPESEFNALVNAKSIGQYFQSEIKGEYDSTTL